MKIETWQWVLLALLALAWASEGKRSRNAVRLKAWGSKGATVEGESVEREASGLLGWFEGFWGDRGDGGGGLVVDPGAQTASGTVVIPQKSARALELEAKYPPAFYYWMRAGERGNVFSNWDSSASMIVGSHFASELLETSIPLRNGGWNS